MKIIKKYLAPWAIPNENIPLHIVWDPNENIKEIILKKPEFLQIKEAFNANYIIEDDFKIKFDNFESNGYFSAELICKGIEVLEKKCNIILEFKKEDIVIDKINLSTKILRPELKPIMVPSEIRIIDVGGDLKVDNPIILQYKGDGKVHVHIQTFKNSELQIKIPEEIKDIIKKFNADFNICLNELKPKYPQYETFFQSLINEELSLSDLESELEVFSEIFKNDIEFTKDFSKKLSWAVTRNYAILDDYIITPFIEYIKSSPIRTVDLINPIWYIEFFRSSKILNIRIEYFDIENNIYKPIEISTKLVGDKNDKIDLYKLFKWELT